MAREGVEATAERQLVDTLPILIMISDGDGRVTYFNERWHEFTGHDKDDLNDWQRYMHPQDGPGVAEAWARAVALGSRQVLMRYRLLNCRTGRYHWFSAQAVAIEDERGNIIRWIGAAVDIDAEVRQRERAVNALASEVQAAQAFQHALLPTTLPAVRGLTMDAEYRVSSNVGLICGDWYDALPLADGRVLFSIGDVTGHGMAAAVDMSRVRQSILAAGANAADPGEILRRVNRACLLQGTTASAIVGIVDMEGRRLELACAGHPRPLRKTRANVVSEVSVDGLLLGVMEQPAWETCVVELRAGDIFLFYTDGLVEYRRTIEREMERLVQAVHDDRMPLQGFGHRLCDAMLGDAMQSDDIAVLALGIDLDESDPRPRSAGAKG